MSRARYAPVVGPLSPYAKGFSEELARLGYRSPHHHLNLMNQVNRWLVSKEASAGDLSPTDLEEIASWRRTAVNTHRKQQH